MRPLRKSGSPFPTFRGPRKDYVYSVISGIFQAHGTASCDPRPRWTKDSGLRRAKAAPGVSRQHHLSSHTSITRPLCRRTDQ